MAARIGQTVSHYKILELIGSGGMGILYKARDLRLDRLVVLKFLPPEYLRNAEARRRFTHEARAASSIDHPNICTVHDIDDTLQGHVFIVMDYYEGETIKEKTARGPLEVDEAIDLALQTARGLSAAHKHRIIHRDIKPANMIVTLDGVVKIVDFGIAKLKDLTDITKDGVLPGTVAYMSPEQARSERVDHRTDIWSLGVVFYEMLTGHRPFEGEFEPALVYSIQNLDSQPPSVHRPGLSPLVDHIATTSLAKEPDQRYGTADAMSTDLELAKSGKETPPDTEGRRRARKTAVGDKAGWFGTVLSSPSAKVVAGIAAVAAIVTLILVTGIFSGQADAQKWKVAILPVQNLTEHPEASVWARNVQENLLPRELTAIRFLEVQDPFLGSDIRGASRDSGQSVDDQWVYERLREADIDYVLEGSIYNEDGGFRLQANLLTLETSTIEFTASVPFPVEKELDAAVAGAVRQIEYYFDVEIVNPTEDTDLQPWIPTRMKTIAAKKAFLEAAIQAYTGVPGGLPLIQKAIELDSTFVAPRVWLVPTLVEAGMTDEAEAQIAALKAVEGESTAFERAMIEYADMFLHGNRREQLAALDKGLLYAPGNHIVHINKGWIEYELGNYEHAGENFRSVVESGMAYPLAYPWYAQVLAKLGRWEEARDVLDQALDLTPVSGEVYILLTAFALRDGDAPSASRYELRAYEILQSSDMGLDQICREVGCLLVDMELPEIADRYFVRALATNPNSALLHADRARAFLQMGDTVAAVAAVNNALSLDSNYAEPHLLLARILDAGGNATKAIARYRTYLQHDSVSVPALEALRRVAMLASSRGSEVRVHPR
jgi:tetratricopeptide (TPR) repeat protein/TolB-like protein